MTNPDEKYFNGSALIGDDYSPAEIARWFDDEREAYAELGAKDRATYHYEYHALNQRHGFRHLEPGRRFSHACGFGSAYGDELLPLRDRLDRVTIIDSSRQFGATLLDGIDASFVAAQADGHIAAASASFDLITCLGVLHHIPNVSFVVSELARCLQPGGMLLVREPTTSMGDWRRPRQGVTRRERGLPAGLFQQILLDQKLKVLHRAHCVFPPLAALFAKAGVSVYGNAFAVGVDDLLCRASAWNYSYHRTSFASRFAPASEFFVCTR